MIDAVSVELRLIRKDGESARQAGSYVCMYVSDSGEGETAVRTIAIECGERPT